MQSNSLNLCLREGHEVGRLTHSFKDFLQARRENGLILQREHLTELERRSTHLAQCFYNSLGILLRQKYGLFDVLGVGAAECPLAPFIHSARS